MSYRKLQAKQGAWGCGNTKCRACHEWVTVKTRREIEGEIRESGRMEAK
jgi:hypothetical protein